jgi:alkylation response protein AidB-like acyl-CoA dehydrogenase
MNFDFSGDQQMLRDQARKFLSERCTSKVVRAVLDDDSKSYDANLWREVAGLGWLSAAIPEEYGGAGLGRVELCAVAEELGRACAPLPVSSTIYGVAEALLLAGSEAQRAKWLPEIAVGSCIGAMASAEGAGELSAKRIGAKVEGGRLSGTKIPVTDGDIADVAVVLAMDESRPTLFVAPLKDPSVKRETLKTLDPTRGAARLEFRETPVERLGAPGAGWDLLNRVYDRMAVYLAFEQIGGADRCLEIARDYAMQRYAFGRTIASYQAIKHKLVTMYAKNQLARSNAYFGAWAVNTDAAELPLAAATARVAASDAFWFASKETIQVHGGMGFTWETDCHLYYRRAQQLSLIIGAPRVWKEKLVSQLENDLADA